jgi:hypothetical protein
MLLLHMENRVINASQLHIDASRGKYGTTKVVTHLLLKLLYDVEVVTRLFLMSLYVVVTHLLLMSLYVVVTHLLLMSLYVVVTLYV